MARGRMINSKICMNKRVSDLSNDTSRLAFTWLISFADVQGRTYGDPTLVKSMLFPRRSDVTTEQMSEYIQEWHDAGLIIRYESGGDQWIAFPKFAENQRGLDRRKEPASDIPGPPDSVPTTEPVRTEAVPSTESICTETVPSTCQVQGNRTEEKRTEQNRNLASAERPPAQSGKNAIRLELENHFIRRTKLPAPIRDTAKQKKAAGERWWNPLRQIAVLCDWDAEGAKALIDRALERLTGLTISAPQSILNTAIAIHAEDERGKGHSGGSPGLPVGPDARAR